MNVEILVNGTPVAKYFDKTGRCYIQANEGSEYEIQIQNDKFHRTLAVVSVDGLSVISGKPADEYGEGYIINGRNSYRIKGFRHSNNAVGAFRFSKKEESYAATNGKCAKRNCGVIGVCLYSEKNCPQWYAGLNEPPPIVPNVAATIDSSYYYYPTLPNYNNVQNMFCAITKDSFDTGTTWGGNKKSEVIEAEFERGDLIYSTDIYYTSRKSLLAMGIIEENKPKISFPKSFPKKYATPPSGWKI